MVTRNYISLEQESLDFGNKIRSQPHMSHDMATRFQDKKVKEWFIASKYSNTEDEWGLIHSAQTPTVGTIRTYVNRTS